MDDGPLLPCRQSVWYSRRYRCAQIRVDGRLVPRLAHRLTLLAFAGLPPEGKTQCRHLNGISTDNRAENLAWGTALDDAADRARLGRVPRGESHYGAKLTARQVRAIRRRTAAPKVQAQRHGVSVKTIHAILRRDIWRHLPD